MCLIGDVDPDLRRREIVELREAVVRNHISSVRDESSLSSDIINIERMKEAELVVNAKSGERDMRKEKKISKRP